MKADAVLPSQDVSKPVLTLNELCELLCVTDRTVRRLEKTEPDFPQPAVITHKLRYWFLDDVLAYLRKKQKLALKAQRERTEAMQAVQ